METHFNFSEGIPVMLLGLQRDLRTDEREFLSPPAQKAPEASEARATGPSYLTEADDLGTFVCVMPQEGLRYAQEMRCDRYMECSALTGELCREVFEDIVHAAVANTKGHGGGKSDEPACITM